MFREDILLATFTIEVNGWEFDYYSYNLTVVWYILKIILVKHVKIIAFIFLTAVSEIPTLTVKIWWIYENLFTFTIGVIDYKHKLIL